MATPNMGLVLPTPTVTPGPQYATENNTAFTVIDLHNHTSGLGAPVPSSGLNINGDLTFQSNNAIALRTSRYTVQVGGLSAPTDLACVYAAGPGGDLFFNDGSGNQIQLTVGGALNAASIGGIGGDYTTSTASVFYTNLTNAFTFWQNTGIAAEMEMGPVTIYDTTLGAFGVTLTANPSMSADYSLSFPVSLPPVQSFMTLDSTGAIAAPWTVDGSTIKIVTNELVAQYTEAEHSWELNGIYSNLTYPLLNIDSVFFAPYDVTILSVWIYSGTAGSGGTTEFDLQVASSGGPFATILSTTGKITSAAASGVWTDSGAVIGAQTGVTKPVISTSTITAGQAIRWDLISSMTGSPEDARIRIFYKRT
jgi:hypothetical protein